MSEDKFNQDDFPKLELPPDMPEEVKEAADNFFKAIAGAAGKRAQELLSACSDEELKKRADKQSMDALISAANLGTQVIGALEILYPEADIDHLIYLHVQFQIAMLSVISPDSGGVTEADMIKSEEDNVDAFVNQHTTGKHMGCLLDEYHRRQQWDELVFDDTDDDGGEVKPCH